MDTSTAATGMSYNNTKFLGWVRLALTVSVFIILLNTNGTIHGAAPGMQSESTITISNESDELFQEGSTPVSDMPTIRLKQKEDCYSTFLTGVDYYEEYNFDESLKYYQQALDCYRQLGSREGEGGVLFNIGVIYHEQGEYQSALLQFAPSLAIALENGNREAEWEIRSRIGIIHYEQGRYNDALAQYEAALDVLREMGNREEEGRLLADIGDVYRSMGSDEEALGYYELSLETAGEVGDRLGEGRALTRIAEYYIEVGRFTDALAYSEEALDIAYEVNSPEGQAVVLNQIGMIYRWQGRYEDALIQYDAALAILREMGNRWIEGEALANRGEIYATLGHHEEAQAQYNEALGIARELHNRSSEAVILSNLGSSYHVQGRYEDALMHVEAALAIARQIGDLPLEGIILSNTGVLYAAQGRYDDALPQQEAALTIARESGNRLNELQALINLGTIYREQENFEDAMARYEEALAITREVDEPLDEVFIRFGMGMVHNAQGAYDDALVQLVSALTIALEVGDPEAEGTVRAGLAAAYYELGLFEDALEQLETVLTIARQLGDRRAEAAALANTGVLYYNQRLYDDASANYEAAMALAESIRATAGNELARTEHIAQYVNLFDFAIDLYLEGEYANKAFFTSERGRARSFLDSIVTGYIEPDDGETARLIEREREAYQTRQAIEEALVRAHGQISVDGGLVADLEADLAAAQADYEAVVNKIVARQDMLRSLIPGRGLDYVLGADEVQAALPADTTLVSYYLYTDHNDEERAVVFVIGQSQFEVMPLSVGEGKLSQVLSDFRDFPNLSDTHPESLRQLYTWLIEPIAGELSTSRLIIIPHGILHYLPFTALTDGKQYLGERFVITTLPSASILPLLDENRASRRTPLVLGNPASDANLDNLPAGEAEAQAVATLYGDAAYIGAEATETLVKEQAGRFGVLHIASHAEFNPTAPLQSGLYLAPDGTNDGLLHVDEVYGLDLTATDLVVLSACETNIGDVSPGDDIVALNRAFLFAGAQTVVASLWSIDDQATSMLMTRFYSYLNEGWGEAEALRQAQIDLRTEHPEYGHPFYWAAFALSGDGGEVTHLIQDTAVLTATAIPVPTTSLEPTVSEPTSAPGLGICAGAAFPLGLVFLVVQRRRSRVAR